MTVPKIDWVVMWKSFHYQFFWVYATIGIPLRFVLVVRRFKMAPSRKKSLYLMLSSFASSLLCTWFPIVPIIFGGVLIFAAGDAAGHAVGESLLIGAPLVAVSMGIETTISDAVVLHRVLKESVREQFVRLLITNVLNASIALAVGLAWAFHHLPTFIAALDNFR
jgi:hypothetical protein